MDRPIAGNWPAKLRRRELDTADMHRHRDFVGYLPALQNSKQDTEGGVRILVEQAFDRYMAR